MQFLLKEHVLKTEEKEPLLHNYVSVTVFGIYLKHKLKFTASKLSIIIQ